MTKLEQLEKYLKSSKEIIDLEDQIHSLKKEYERLCSDMQLAETMKLPEDEINKLAVECNEVDFKRVKLALRKNRLEKEILLFEYDTLTCEKQNDVEKSLA